ncbi:TPA: efflux RND transporter periplasmic adaptor subunit [Stenotrophomonas maltophilia]|jgi:multidrug efflux system membrane fusion protein|uniref:efflux RND transporter periplasmic adaptor subunit n=1 Tax=Stenotrophomonas maltophilia TaxID=40324 RepID=UPI000C15018F|nr:efflux RND transporter periplasmic adaptor subunit [Stenotrophomonas maltophilia]EKT4075294.1 efflux RND transporter periplasmic adaptor subunit [Stenotrophomonas maltophilia]EKT4077563.1 efflux RND transporter periplasmic adaptor subunit [Stenotrophomonas maltophilia]EKT4083458.1 efflux RND transporter periplasmic adaptor subunit [Stenotrophomonas maltophilia]EKT4086078.1 efflux RND transporter periplasmic adaptor subunit [Stenotrophomonas maltophilia]EKT4096395.1 efflux RND transporter pe
MRTFRTPVALIAALALAMTACSAPEATPEATPRVSVVTVGPQVVQRDDELPGRVAAVRTAQIRAQVGGIVQRRLFEQGAEVRAGQALFQIDPAAFRADVDSALAALQRSEAALGRSRVQSQRLHALAAAQAVSQQHRDDASAEYEQARAAVNEARAILARRQLDLRYATVSAPIAGRIDQALVTEGALVGVADAEPMAVVQQIDQVYVDVRQPAAQLESLQRSAGGGELPVTIIGAAGKPLPERGQMLFSGINVDARTGDVILRILVDNPQRQLLPGMYVRAKVPRGAPASALTVPQQAVLRSAGGQAYAWVIGGDGKAVIRTLEVDGSVDRQWLVRTGLKAGEKVVVEGQERLQEGVVVDARDWQMPVASAGAVQAGSKG